MTRNSQTQIQMSAQHQTGACDTVVSERCVVLCGIRNEDGLRSASPVVYDDSVRCLQVQTEAPRSGGEEEHACFGVRLVEAGDGSGPVVTRDTTVNALERDVQGEGQRGR